MFTQLLAAIAAIPELLKAVQQLVALFKKADEEKWFAKNNEIFSSQLPKAETKEEFEQVAEEIQNQLKKL